MSISETFHGYIETTQDSLLVLEACRRNILPKISRRLQDREKKLVRSGAVFVFDEKDSGIKRWTDGLIWSPSRILGNFLIYRELDKKKKEPQKKKPSKRSQSIDDGVGSGGGGGGKIRARSNSASSIMSSSSSTAATDSTTFDQNTFQRNRERQIVGSLSESFNFKQNGLIKKTMSLIVEGSPLHLVSYYHPDDVLERQLRAPSVVPELANLEISSELLSRQNFRIPPMVEQPSSDSNIDMTGKYEPFSNNNITLATTTTSSATGFTLPTPTQSTPNTPLPTSPLLHHSISTPLKPRLPSTLYNAQTKNHTGDFMDFYNTTATNNNAANTRHHSTTQRNISMPLSASLFNGNSNNLQIPYMIPEEPMEHDNGQVLQ